MRSALNDLLPGDSRSQRRRGLVSESRERLFTTQQSHMALNDLGKAPGRVHCPWCKQTTTTRVRRSDSRTTKKVNALLWAGFGDPLALAAFDWCQNIDHFCSRCGTHLTRKPYKGEMQVIAEDAAPELPLGGHNERTELPADPNHVSELHGDQRITMQREAHKQVIAQPGPSQMYASRVVSPAEMDWQTYESSISSYDQTAGTAATLSYDLPELPIEHHDPPRELPVGRSQRPSELRNSSTIRR